MPSLHSCLSLFDGSNIDGLAVVLSSKQNHLLTVLSALVAGSVAGCARPVLISEDAPIRIGPDTEGCVYILLDGEWTLTDEPVELPEGWYAVPPSFVDDEDEED